MGDLKPAGKYLQGGRWKDGVKLSQHCLIGEGDRLDMYWSRRVCSWAWEAFFLTRTVSQQNRLPERQCSLHPWRFWRPYCTKPWGALAGLIAHPACGGLHERPWLSFYLHFPIIDSNAQFTFSCWRVILSFNNFASCQTDKFCHCYSLKKLAEYPSDICKTEWSN